MTHHYDSEFGPNTTPLSHFTANRESKDFQLLIRVVNVNDEGKVTLPVRELWAKVDGNVASGNLEFLLNKSNSPEDDEEESLDTIAEANEAMHGRHWLRSLEPRSPFEVAGTGDWYVTALVKAEPCIWEKVDGGVGGAYYKLHEKNLRAWLVSGGDGAEEFDDEEYWDCVSCNSDDEAPERGNGDDDDDDDEEDHHHDDEERPSGFNEYDQRPDGDDDEEPSEPVDEHPNSAGVDDDEESLKPVDNVQIYDSDDFDDDTEDGGVRLSPDQMKPARMFNFTLVGCEAEADAGYDGDA